MRDLLYRGDRLFLIPFVLLILSLRDQVVLGDLSLGVLQGGNLVGLIELTRYPLEGGQTLMDEVEV